MIRDFKAFVLRGNVVDLAIAVVIGAAFGAVVSALVKDIVTPLISIPGKADFANLTFIDSMGLGVIVREQSRLRGEAPDRQVVVRHANAHARKVFEITGLDRVLDIQP